MELPAAQPWFKQYHDLRQKAIQKFQAAGATLRVSEFGNAKFVHLEKRKVTDELLDQLRWAGGVERLYLAKTGITDQQLDLVGLEQNVRRLSLWSNPITDEGLSHLTAMWSLEVLDIHDTQITAQGLNTLAMLRNLQTLIVPDHIDPADLAPLTDKHPHLEIIPRSPAPRPSVKSP